MSSQRRWQHGEMISRRNFATIAGATLFASTLPSCRGAAVNSASTAFSEAPPSFDEAIRGIREIIARDTADPTVATTGLPRLYSHGKPSRSVVVLFHGFTNCPQQFDELARLYYARGCNVYVPRIPRHGLKDRVTLDLANLTVPELQRSAEEASYLGSGLGREVSVVGLSLGGTMALWLTQTRRIHLAVPIAPFLMPISTPRSLGNAIMLALYKIPSMYWWWDSHLKEKCLPFYAYPGYPTHALAEIIFFGDAVFAQASKTNPRGRRCVIVLNADDPAVNNSVTRNLLLSWNRHGAGYEELLLTGLRPAHHDIIDPVTYPQGRRSVYPRLEALVLTS